MFSTGNSVVDEIGSFHFEGNVIPHVWFQNIKLGDKPDVVAIILLSEIVYWYRPALVRDEQTGRIISYKKRFKADLLQRNYESFAEQFGFSKRQVRAATDRLVDLKVIKKHFRNIVVNNKKLSNVLFIDVIPKYLFLITYNTPYDIQTSHPMTLKRHTLWHSNVTPYDIQTSDKYRDYDTEITNTEITKENIKEMPKKNQNPFDEILNLWNPDRTVFRNFVKSALGSRELSDDEIKIILLEVNSRNEQALRNGRISESRMFTKCVQWLKTGDMYKQIAESKFKSKSASKSHTQNNRNVNQNWSQDSSKYKPVDPNEGNNQ